MKAIETVIKTVKSNVGSTIELTTINHVVFGDCYYIYTDGKLEHFQYGKSRLDVIFNEFVSNSFDISLGY